jgi:hypothetical protein
MSGSTRPLVVAVCGDPGGANAVAPVIEALRADGRVTVNAFAYRQACMLWTKRNLVFDNLGESTSRTLATQRLCNSETGLLLTGTSFNPIEPEKEFIAAARGLGLPSLAVLDFWTNYARRFSDADGRLVYVPDRIAVMDERARDEMVAEGFDQTRLVITGQPAFDDLAVWRSRFTPARRQAIRDALNIGPSAWLILFASQPLSLLYGIDPVDPLYPGYDEQMVLRALVIALDQIAEQSHQEIVLLIRPHPREQIQSFDDVKGRLIRTVVSTDGESRDLMMAADLVTGMNTILLVDACYLGCVTVSLQPGLRFPDPLPTNPLGFSRGVYREEEIKPVVERMLLDKEIRSSAQVRLSKFHIDNGATRRVAKLVYQMVRLE